MNEHYAVTIKNDHSAPAIFEGSKKSVINWLSSLNDNRELDVYIQGEGYLDIPHFLSRMCGFVHKFYAMDPENEDLFTGGQLRNGMQVLIGASNERARSEEGRYDWEIDRLMEFNRWCTIADLEKTSGGNLFFTGVYEDGTKRRRSHPVRSSWLVKLDSIPTARQSDELRSQLFEVVIEAMRKSRDDDFGDAVVGAPKGDREIANETVQYILDLL